MDVWVFSVGENYEGSAVAGIYTTESAARAAMIARAQGDVDSLNRCYTTESEPEDGEDNIVDPWGDRHYTLGSFDPETVTCLGFGCDYYIIRKYEVLDG